MARRAAVADTVGPVLAGRFVKGRTTVPEARVQALCDQLPALLQAARGINTVDARS